MSGLSLQAQFHRKSWTRFAQNFTLGWDLPNSWLNMQFPWNSKVETVKCLQERNKYWPVYWRPRTYGLTYGVRRSLQVAGLNSHLVNNTKGWTRNGTSSYSSAPKFSLCEIRSRTNRYTVAQDQLWQSRLCRNSRENVLTLYVYVYTYVYNILIRTTTTNVL